MIVIIHGYGQTDVARYTLYYELPSWFSARDLDVNVDKPGHGESTETFDADHPVETSCAQGHFAVF
jgi:hypothetical protein